MTMETHDPQQPDVDGNPHDPETTKNPKRVPWVIAGLGGALLLLGLALLLHAEAGVNKVALAATPKAVTVIPARAAQYRPSRRYVGTLSPWVDAKVGPQFISAYIDTVLVRPGSVVKKGDVLATLDCRNASATSQAVTQQARALESMQAAIHHESERVSQLQDGGFVSPNEVEQKSAEAASKQAQVLALQAQMAGSSLQVHDCILRSPFDGDVSERLMDPGAFAKPGNPIVTVVDRSIIRLTTDVPEDDFGAVPPGTLTKIHVIPTGEDMVRPVSRRAPAADPSTRTVHIEIDLPDSQKHLPVYTTAEVSVDVGQPVPATTLPLAAVSIRGSKASLFTVQDGKAHAVTVPVLGEAGGDVYLATSLAPGTQVVLEGRTLLNDQDAVSAKAPEAPPTSASPQQRSETAPVTPPATAHAEPGATQARVTP